MGETLSAVVPGTIEDGNGLTTPNWTYQWLRTPEGAADSEEIAGETGAGYTLAAADAGHAVSLRVSFTDDDGFTETRESEPTELVLAAADSQVAPLSADSRVAAREDTPYTFKTADFPFTDANRDDTLASVKIVSLPKMGLAGFGGALSLDGDAIASGDLPQTVSAADIGKLAFTPVTGQFGDGDVSFTFRVNDGEADSRRYLHHDRRHRARPGLDGAGEQLPRCGRERESVQ